LGAKHFDAVIGRKDLGQLRIERWYVVDQVAVILIMVIPKHKAFIKRLLKDLQLGMQLKDLVQAGAAAPRVCEENEMGTQIHTQLFL
jgi:hypothetical protein